MNVVEQIMYPHLEEAIEKLEAAHQIEIASLRDEMQGQIDDLQDRVNNAEEAISLQVDCLYDYKKECEKEERLPTIAGILKALDKGHDDLSRWHKDFELVSTFSEMLEKASHNLPERVVEVERVRTVTVEKIPTQLLSDLKSIAGFVGKWVE